MESRDASKPQLEGLERDIGELQTQLEEIMLDYDKIATAELEGRIQDGDGRESLNRTFEAICCERENFHSLSRYQIRQLKERI